jgi:CheY-like chemotaxis protein
MRNLVSLLDAPTFEALPRRVARGPARVSIGEPPSDDELLFSGAQQSSSSGPAHLPRVLAGLRVLVVDDDEDTAQLFAVALTACGAEVVTASSTSEALRILSGHVPDVVVSDIAMPGADGYSLVRQIRQLPDPRISNVPVLAVTAFGREHFRERVLAAGFHDHLEKPVDPERLCLAVAQASGR